MKYKVGDKVKIKSGVCNRGLADPENRTPVGFVTEVTFVEDEDVWVVGTDGHSYYTHFDNVEMLDGDLFD